jgi:hypothetical protein
MSFSDTLPVVDRSLAVENVEGILGPYLALLRLSILLPSKTMENETAEGNG